jgi:hypothetical protein
MLLLRRVLNCILQGKGLELMSAVLVICLSRPPSSYPAAFQDPYAGLHHVVPSGQLNQNPAPYITPHPGPQLPQNANL